MEKDFLVKLTNELYQITLLFPKRDPLRHKIRDLGTDILAQVVMLSKENPRASRDLREELFLKLENNLAVLDSYFEVAQIQGWISPKDIVETKNQYSKIKQELGVFAVSKKVSEQVSEVEPREVIQVQGSVLKPRQKKLLEVLAKQGRAQIKDLKTEFPNTSKRTLRRDLKDLLDQGIVERIGEGNDTFYKYSMSGIEYLG